MSKMLPGLILALALLVAAPPLSAQPDSLAFHGLRMGMSPEQVEAAGYRTLRLVMHAAGTLGRELSTEQVETLHSLVVYFFQDRLYEISAFFKPMPYEQARELTRATYAQYGAPENQGDGLWVSVTWFREGVKVHYGAEPHPDDRFAPSLLLTLEEQYRAATKQVEPPARAGF